MAAWACAFAHHLKRPDPDAAMLAGLMLDIGQFYLLARAARYPALEGDMGRFAEVVTTWDEPVRDAVLQALEMPERIINACAADPFANTDWPPAELADVVFLATLAAESPNPFDNLLGSRQRGELLEASEADGLDHDGFDALVAAARAHR